MQENELAYSCMIAMRSLNTPNDDSDARAAASTIAHAREAEGTEEAAGAEAEGGAHERRTPTGLVEAVPIGCGDTAPGTACTKGTHFSVFRGVCRNGAIFFM